MLTNYTIRFMKCFSAASIVAMWMFGCLLSVNAEAQTKTPQKDAAQQSATVTAPRSVILPAVFAQQMEMNLQFSQNPNVHMLARNAGSVEITGFPYPEKLERMIIDYVSARPIEPDEYIRFMLPGPLIFGDNKKDAMHYEAALKLYFAAHPEVRLAAPSGVLAMFDDPNGYMKLIELQFNSGNYVAFGPRETAPGPAQIKE